jgi:RNA polymerase sigma-70 factor (ECF subfamily)
MAGWHAVLDDVMRERGGRLVAYGTLLVGQSAAEDLVQDALIRSFSRGRDFPSVAAAESYVRRTMATMSIDAWRRLASRRRSEERSVADWAPPAQTHDVDTSVDVEAALARLAPRIRACVVLRFYDDLTVREIADQLGIAEGTVKRNLYDAASMLSGTFDAHPKVEPGGRVSVVAERGSSSRRGGRDE